MGPMAASFITLIVLLLTTAMYVGVAVAIVCPHFLDILVLVGTAAAVLATCVAATATANPLLLDLFDFMKM